jgi:tetrapyrrole methylase family protein/MazG family protein
MTSAALTVLGLGPGSMNDLTLEAYQLLEEAAHRNQIVYLRTEAHPAVNALKQRLSRLQLQSFDHIYTEADDWEQLSERIADEICSLAGKRTVIYAVPGHPLIGEFSVQRVLSRAREQGINIRIVAGVSFLEPVCAALEIDPLNHSTQLIDASELAALSSDSVPGKLIPTLPLLVTHVHNRRLAGQVKQAISPYYPEEWSLKLVRLAGKEGEEQISELGLQNLDCIDISDPLSVLYVPPVDALTALRLPETLRYITMRLRREPDGCPWDRKQTHQSLKRYVVEETYEVIEALDENDMEKLAEELGDLLLQVYLHAEIARQANEFSIGDVYEHVNAKLIRRHPHVFGNVSVSGAEQVIRNWEEIKRQERASAGQDVNQESVLDRVPPGLPALTIAQEYQKRVAKIGFEFEQMEDVYKKLEEELTEFRQATSLDEQREEIGDVLFMVVNLARMHRLDAEEALRLADRKFRQRFQAVEQLARQIGKPYTDYSAQEWDELWQKAKASL